jgi:hypothetical protein
MTLAYGSRFTNQWGGLDPKELKDHWARELGCFRENPAALRHGLNNMDDSKPPTPAEFRKLCSGVPRPFLALPSPLADKAVVKGLLARLNVPSFFAPITKQPAERLRERELAGDTTLNSYQKKYWRQVLGVDTTQQVATPPPKDDDAR